MKSILVLIVLSISILTNAQNVQEWTQQKKTQKKYLLQQIAALQIYLGYLKKGYDVVDKGLTTIQNIKDGDFNLHRDFFGSLKQVNPKIKKNEKVTDIIAYQLRIIKQAKQTVQIIRETSQFTTKELGYCKMVFDNLLKESLKNINELFFIISHTESETNGYQMKDDERMKRIDALYLDMQNKYAFSSSFSDEMGLLSFQRAAEQIEINRSRILNDLR